MKAKLSAAGAVVVAALASSCCWGPLVLAGLGAGGAGFASALGPYRPFLLGMTVAFLAGAWYFTLRKRPAVAAPSPREASTCGDACCAPNSGRRRNILLLWGVTAVSVAMLAFPHFSAVLARNHSPTPALGEVVGPVEVATLAIQGMTCEACEGHIREALLKVPGVLAAEVDYRTASARVSFRQGRVSTDQLKQAVAETGYRATTVTPNPAPSSEPRQASAASAEALRMALLGIEGMT